MCEIRRVSPNFIHEFSKSDCNNERRFLSPVNLKLDCMTKIELPELKWLNMDSEPQSTKVANTGQTVIVSGSWQKNRPKITGGPLLTTYAFSQLHYHWGSDNTHGSEHSYNDRKVPLEMHAVFLKENCRKQEEALGEKDGAVVVSYAYKLNDEPNPGIKLVCDELPYIPNPSQLIELEDPVKLTTFVVPFKNDYFVYWGSVRTNACKHILLWILCRQPYAVSEKQLEVFRSLFTSGHQPIMNNCRHVHSQGYEVFHINPSGYKDDVLYRGTENNLCKKVITIERIIEMKKRRRSRSARYLIRNRNSSILSLNQEKGTENKGELMKTKTKISCISLSSNDSSYQQRLMKEPFKKTDEATAFKILNKPRRQSYYSKFFSEKNKKVQYAREKHLKSENNSLSEEVMSVKQNKKLMDDEDDDEASKLRQLNSYYNETKRKYKNDNYEQQDDSDLTGMINPKVLNNSGRNNFYSPYSEHKSKINDLETTEDDRDKLDIIQENCDWENFSKFKKNNGKEVTFSEELNMNTVEFFDNNVCFNRSNNESFMGYKTKGINKFHEDMYADRHEELNEVNFCSMNIDSNNTNNRLVSRNKEKVVQDVGINTLSLNELIMALSLEYDNETKRCSKLINRNSSHSILPGSNRGDSDCEDDNLTIGSTEKQKPNAECNEENTSNFPRYIPVKYSQNDEKHIKNRTQSAVSLSTENSSIPSRVSSLEKRTKKLLNEENTIRNSSSSSNQSDSVLSGSNRKSYRKPSYNLWSQEKYKDKHINRPQTPSCKAYKKITPPQSRCSNLTDKPERIPSTHIFKSSSTLNNESYNFQPSIHLNKINRENTEVINKRNKSLKRKAQSRPKSSHKKDEVAQNQESEEITNKCLYSQSISQTTYECDDEFKNRSSLLTTPSQYKISKTNTIDPECHVNQSEQDDFETFSYGESTVEDDSQSDLTLTPSIQTRMSHKYEEIQILKSNELLKPQKSKSKKKCVKKLKSSAKESKSNERQSKFLMCKDSLQLLDNKRVSGGQTTRIPLRKSLLQKNYLNSFTRERPQSVASSRQNGFRTSIPRPRTMEGILMNRNRVTSETRLRSQIPTFKAGSSGYSRTESILKNYDRRMQQAKPATPAWRY